MGIVPLKIYELHKSIHSTYEGLSKLDKLDLLSVPGWQGYSGQVNFGYDKRMSFLHDLNRISIPPAVLT